MSLQPPQSSRQLATQAKVDFNTMLRLRYWIATAEHVLREAEIYEREGRDEQAYILLLRFAELAIRHLPNHPEARMLTPDSKGRLQTLTGQLPSILTRLEAIKARVDARYNNYVRSSISYVPSTSPSSSSSAIYGRPSPSSTYSNLTIPRPNSDLSWGKGNVLIPQSLQAGKPLTITPVIFSEDQVVKRGQLARELSERELQRRATERIVGGRKPSGRYSGIMPTVVAPRQSREDYDPYSSSRHEPRRVELRDESSRVNDFDLARSIKALGRMLVRDDPLREREREKRPEPERHASWTYKYPAVPKRTSTPVEEESWSSKSTPTLPPKIPHLPRKIEIQKDDDKPPPIPGKEPAPPPKPKTPTPVDPVKAEEAVYQFTPSAYLENGNPLRTLFLPSELRESFLSIATPNTTRNLETCGILCGTVISNALFVSVLVIPEQEATSDTCTTKDEEELFDYVFGQELMILGWIHTHPTQTCFMSSVDCHTQCSYQLMLEESVAVVCAPRSTPDWGVFRLTNPPGIPTISSCRNQGLFHPHPGVREGELYVDALRPGHVALFDSRFEVVDLRKG